MLLLNLNLNDDLKEIRNILDKILYQVNKQTIEEILKLKDGPSEISLKDIRSNSYIAYSVQYWKEQIEKILKDKYGIIQNSQCKS